MRSARAGRRSPPEQQQRLTAAFSRYTISVYANRFDDYGGEHFEVDPNPVANPNGLLVKTSLVKSNGEKIELNYLMRQDTTGAWKVIDVYLSGTISELATRRAEFQAVVQRDGAEGLVPPARATIGRHYGRAERSVMLIPPYEAPCVLEATWTRGRDFAAATVGAVVLVALGTAGLAGGAAGLPGSW